MSAVFSPVSARKMPKLAGGCASRSTSVLSETIWSRASRSVDASRSLLAAVVRTSCAGVGEPALQDGDVVGVGRQPLAQPGELLAERADLGDEGSRGPRQQNDHGRVRS